MKIRYLLVSLTLICSCIVAVKPLPDVNYDGCDTTNKNAHCTCFNAGTKGTCTYGAYMSDEGRPSHGHYCSCRNKKTS